MYLENPDGITWRVKKVLAVALGEGQHPAAEGQGRALLRAEPGEGRGAGEQVLGLAGLGGPLGARALHGLSCPGVRGQGQANLPLPSS